MAAVLPIPRESGWRLGARSSGRTRRSLAQGLGVLREPALSLGRRLMPPFASLGIVLAWCVVSSWSVAALAQVAPSRTEISGYTGLFAAAARGDAGRIESLVAAGAAVDARDGRGRTPLHVAAFAGHHDAMRALVAAGADPDALEHDRYDIVTIAAVADDVPTLDAALDLGASATNVTSRYDGTALIAAAHLGHADVVRRLVEAGAPLDHVNNLGWTAVIESVVLGDGGPRHTETLRILIEAGADVNLADRQGRTPLALAETHGFEAMTALLRRAGGR